MVMYVISHPLLLSFIIMIILLAGNIQYLRVPYYNYALLLLCKIILLLYYYNMQLLVVFN